MCTLRVLFHTHMCAHTPFTRLDGAACPDRGWCLRRKGRGVEPWEGTGALAQMAPPSMLFQSNWFQSGPGPVSSHARRWHHGADAGGRARWRPLLSGHRARGADGPSARESFRVETRSWDLLVLFYLLFLSSYGHVERDNMVKTNMFQGTFTSEEASFRSTC